MLTTLDQLVPVPPRAPTVPTDFADADALAAWLNTHPAATGERAARPWEPDLTQDGEALIVWCAVPQDADHVAHLVGYWFTGPAAMPGEWGVDPVPPEIAATGRLFRFWCDTTKSRRDDFGDPLELLPGYLADGAPPYKTNRVGPAGTRPVAGLGRAFVAWR